MYAELPILSETAWSRWWYGWGAPEAWALTDAGWWCNLSGGLPLGVSVFSLPTIHRHPALDACWSSLSFEHDDVAPNETYSFEQLEGLYSHRDGHKIHKTLAIGDHMTGSGKRFRFTAFRAVSGHWWVDGSIVVWLKSKFISQMLTVFYVFSPQWCHVLYYLYMSGN